MGINNRQILKMTNKIVYVKNLQLRKDSAKDTQHPNEVPTSKIKLNFDSLISLYTADLEKRNGSDFLDRDQNLLKLMLISLGYDFNTYNLHISKMDTKEGIVPDLSLIQLFNMIFDLNTENEIVITNAKACGIIRYQLLLYRFHIIHTLKKHPLFYTKSVPKNMLIYTNNIFKPKSLSSDNLALLIREGLRDSFQAYKIFLPSIISCHITSASLVAYKKMILAQIIYEKDSKIGNVNDLATYLTLCYGQFSTPFPHHYTLNFNTAQHLQVSTYFEEIELLYILERYVICNTKPSERYPLNLLQQIPITQLITIPFNVLTSCKVISNNQFAHIIDLLNINVTKAVINFHTQILPLIPKDHSFPPFHPDTLYK